MTDTLQQKPSRYAALFAAIGKQWAGLWFAPTVGTKENPLVLPEGTSVVYESRKNADGSRTITDQYFLFPDGSHHPLCMAVLSSGQS